MWSEWLARTLKPAPARKAARRAAVHVEEPVLEATAEPDVPAVPQECALPPHEAALARAAAAARGSL